MKKNYKKEGFTLVELVITMILVGIMAMVMVVKWPNKVINLNGEAQQIASGIRLAQSMSMTRSERFRIHLYSDRYQILDSTGSAVAGLPAVFFGNGISLSIPGTLPNDYIAFSGKGEPYTDTSTPLGSAATLTLNGGGNSKQAVVSPETGRVLVP